MVVYLLWEISSITERNEKARIGKTSALRLAETRAWRKGLFSVLNIEDKVLSS